MLWRWNQDSDALRQMIFTQGRSHGIIVLGLLADEYAARGSGTAGEANGRAQA